MKVDRRTLAALFVRRIASKTPDVIRAMRDAERETAMQGVHIARELSKGRWTSAHLRAMGHPYRIGGRPPSDPSIVNTQSGFFLSAWVVRPQEERDGKIQTRIENFAPYAKYLHTGTSKMIRRPILAKVRELLAPIRRRILAEKIRRVFRG